MNRHVTVNDVTRSINYKQSNTHGGFFAYLKITAKIWWMALNILNLIKIFSPWKAIYMIPWTLVVITLKTPWWLFLKPFGWFYSSYITWVGTYQTRNDVIVKSDVKKHITHKLFGIPIFKHQAAMKKADWDHVGK
jgi:hypothetical protein